MNRYEKEVEILNEIVRLYDIIKEDDITGAFHLMKYSLQAFNRWSVIRCEYRKGLKRGEKTEEKDRLEDICRYLKEVHTNSRMIWKYAKESYNNKEWD